jgi:predicted CXXCH cytochrome family protein
MEKVLLYVFSGTVLDGTNIFVGEIMFVEREVRSKEEGKQPSLHNLTMLLPAVLVGLSLLLVPVFCSGAEKGKKSGPQLTVVAPPDGAFVTEKTVFLSGFISGAKVKGVKITGSGISVAKAVVPVKDGTFGSLITFKPGKNQITVSAAGLTRQIKIYFTPEKSLKKGQKAPDGYKRFYVHSKAGELNCKECHSFRRGKFNFSRVSPARSNCTTGECHPKMGKDAAHVHGPVGAGVCISCHNPHGSFEPLQMERTGQELCVVCHEAKREEFDKDVVHPPVEDGCVDCHDPHQSPMRFQLRGNGKQVSSLCFECHEAEIFTNKHQHGPVATGDCIACHNPHASPNNKLLIAPQEQGKLCFECHENVKDQMGRKVLHDPVSEDCNNCHDPHSSANRFQLIAPTEKLCESCHRDVSPDIYESIDKAVFKHEPVAKGQCTECHLPHGSEVSSLLKGKGIKLCGSCHEELGYEIANSKNLHGPVKTGACAECHNVHGSGFSRLLVRNFPEKFYLEYKAEEYDLCFGCHNKDVAKTKNTSKLTNFRDQEYNLHFFHVNRKKGRNCIACHNPHASDQAKHIRYEVPFGRWSYPIEFTTTKNGGGCLVGCHAPKDYDRNKAVGKPSKSSK